MGGFEVEGAGEFEEFEAGDRLSEGGTGEPAAVGGIADRGTCVDAYPSTGIDPFVMPAGGARTLGGVGDS